MLGGNAEQLLSGVPDNVIWCLEERWLLRVACAAPRHLWPWSLRTTVVSPLVAESALAWVLHVVFRLRAHVPLTSLAACPGMKIESVVNPFLPGGGAL
jgi:hypothetical protein